MVLLCWLVRFKDVIFILLLFLLTLNLNVDFLCKRSRIGGVHGVEEMGRDARSSWEVEIG